MTGLLLALALQAAPGAPRLLDGFDRPGVWTAHPAEGVQLAIRSGAGRAGRAMRLDFAFTAGGGYAIARRPLGLDLPANYAFSFWLRGEAPPNTIEFKLVDRSGENVWWYTERDRAFDGRWHRITIRRRQIQFAWGPAGGGALGHAAALELVITAGRGGGSGSVWIDDLVFTPLPETGPYNRTPRVTASAARPGHGAAAALDGDSTTAWRAAAASATLTVDFLERREYGGLTLAWEPGRAPSRYAVLLSDDGRRWREVARRGTGPAGRDYLFLPDTESRFVRLRLLERAGAAGYGLRELRVEPLEWSASRNAFFSAVAQEAPRGSYPRYFLDERPDWTVVGVDGAPEEALFGEDGSLETGAGELTLEPFLSIGGRLITWSDARHALSLEQERLPIPSVEWRTAGLTLRITAFAVGPAERSSAVVRYRIRNEGPAAVRGEFVVALRPFQVNPPWQFLGIPGGAARIDSLRWDGARVTVNGVRAVRPLVRPARFGATAFASGEIVEHLRRGRLPAARVARDGFGAASGALAWALALAPGDSLVVAVEVPLGREGRPLLRGPGAADSALAATAARWAAVVDRAGIELPGTGDRAARVAGSTLAYILINRDGPAIQPGSRSYERSWIRDGALTSAALLRFGHPEPVRAFLRWFARHQYPSGKVPCCVDRRGADPVPEHDSHGQLIYLAAELYRHTGDRPVLEEVWPRVLGAADYIDSLRRTRRTPEYAEGDKRIFYGLLPPSISHEGYSAKPMHSYWDDFFALRGLKDAAMIATVLGRPQEAARLAARAEEFARDLYGSIERAMAHHRIDFIPGAADLGDFDATSTTIAIAPGGELARLPRAALDRTFDRYWSAVRGRPDSTGWDAYTPYELRTVGTMLRLGHKDRALALLEAFLDDQTPREWNQWPEVVWRVPRTPKFIGDLPHTWVGSDFLRSFADLFAYEREADSALVIGAGIAEPWLADGGLAVRRLGTWWGPISYRARREAGGAAVLTLEGGLRMPPGGLLIHSPGERRAARVLVDGRPATPGAGGTILLRTLPATIRFEP
ncbi:MAG TPA: discoidin domain-containing protein [Gemmatimonadales bacterium]|nr:discoidin domain-containing protein [Gemmatimonadales bacterium]